MNTHNENEDTNPDAITGAPGSHPVATGVGAGSAGLAGAAIGTAVGGPVGGVIGSAIGAVVGGLAGKGVGEVVDPTAEDAYWRDNHSSQTYAAEGDYDLYEPAYRAGYTGYTSHGTRGRSFDEAESDISSGYDQSRLSWEKARHASRAAWERAASQHKK